MKYIPNYSTSPSDNLAYEQFLLEHKVQDEPLLFFYINRPSVIIGKNQNTYAQVNLDYVWKHGITVVRRMSGGGAVYHDEGNLNYSFILPNADKMLDFKTLTKPIVGALRKMGADVELSGRNDLEIDHQKVSGVAMYQKDGKLVIHGTLLYKSDLSRLNDILQVKESKIASKGVKSVRARVTNIAPHLNAEYQNLSTEEFRQAIIQNLENVDTDYDQGISLVDLQAIGQLKEQYYDNHMWNFGKIQDFNYQESHKYDFGEVEVAMQISDGIVQQFNLYGDYFAKKDMTTLEQAFTGLVYNYDVFANCLADIDLHSYLPQMSKEELLKLCFS